MVRKGAYWKKATGLGLGVVLLSGIGFGLALFYPLRYERTITAFAAQHGLDPYLVFGVVRAESRFRPRVVSPAGAIGLMQITPDTGRWIAEKLGVQDFTVDDLYRPETNVRFGVWYLHYLIDRFGGDVDAALLAYNAGPGNLSRWQSGKGKVFPESAGYLAAVKRDMRAYRILYGSVIGRFLRLFNG